MPVNLEEAAMVPEHWKVILDGHPTRETGHVITRDGEIIGTWTLIDDVFYAFTPEGSQDQLFFSPHLGLLCSDIEEWH
jgi:hypothetical protein